MAPRRIVLVAAQAQAVISVLNIQQTHHVQVVQTHVQARTVLMAVIQIQDNVFQLRPDVAARPVEHTSI
jgi:hypothetical protein